jgi:Tfp pilus assembly protein PilF
MPVTFQRIQIFVVLLLLVRCPIAARASEPITVIYGRGRESLMNLTMNGQSQLEKGDFAAAQRSLDAVIKADPTFYPAYYIRAEVFLDQRKYEAIQDYNEALRKDSTFAEAALLRVRANYYLSRYGESSKRGPGFCGVRIAALISGAQAASLLTADFLGFSATPPKIAAHI